MKGFIDDNPNLNHVLKQLQHHQRRAGRPQVRPVDVLTTLSKFTASLAEAIASGPYFKVMIVNLLPYWILQPWVDAAFKKRGIDPEEFWGNAGLPSFRYPDPNGQRQANGAPPPAPTPLEGTPENPGPGRHRRHAVLVHPRTGQLPDLGEPAAVREHVGRPIRRQSVWPELRGAGTQRRRPAAEPGRGGTGARSPECRVPWRDAALRPGIAPPPFVPGPPGARTVPVAPLPGIRTSRRGPSGDGTSPLPPALVGPPPPPGPGPQLPPADTPPLPGNPPFLPPGSQG